jgi:hypothetical protein
MDKLEHYLDQVCRGVGGPRSLRQHLRRELREHLLDAAAEHRAAGFSEEQSLARALDDFGGPEQVRLELEATHGHRMMAVVIDQAMQWKEMTMKAKWFWATWAQLALAIVIAKQALFLLFVTIKIIPAYEKIRGDGLLDTNDQDTQILLSYADSCLVFLVQIARHFVNYWFLWVLLLAVAWGLFEWRVRSENKPFMRLSALGMAALVLAVAVGVTALSLLIPYVAALPPLYARAPEPIVRDQVATVSKSIRELEQAMAKKDWQASQEHATKAERAARYLAGMGAAAPALMSLTEQARLDALREQLSAADECLWEANKAIIAKDAGRLDAAMQKFHEAYGQVPGGGAVEKVK